MATQGSDGSQAKPESSSGPRSDVPFAAALPGVTGRWVWGVFGILFLVHLLESVDRWLLPAVLRPVSEELGLTDAQAGWLATVLLISHAVWAPIVGYFADRLRRPRLMAIGIAVWGLATVGTGLARSYTEAQMARGLVGIGGSTFGVIALTILMDLYPRGVRGRVLSAYYLAMPIGAALALSVGSVIARAATWHTAFLVAGAPGLVLALLVLALPDPVRGTSEGIEEHRLRLHERVGPSREDYVDLMVNSSYTYSVFGLAFSMFAIGGLIVWLPTFLVVTHNVPSARGEPLAGRDRARGDGSGHGCGRLARGPLLARQSAGAFPGAGHGDAGLYPLLTPRTLWPWRGNGLAGNIPHGRAPVHQCRAVPCDHCQRGHAQYAGGRLCGGHGGHSPAGRSLVAHPHGLGFRHIRAG